MKLIIFSILFSSVVQAGLPKSLENFLNTKLYRSSSLQEMSFKKDGQKTLLKLSDLNFFAQSLQGYDIERSGRSYTAKDATGLKRIHTYEIKMNRNGEVRSVVSRSPLGTIKIRYYYRNLKLGGQNKSVIKKMKVKAYVGKLIENKSIVIKYKYVKKVLVPSSFQVEGTQTISGQYPVLKRKIKTKMNFTDHVIKA